MNQLTPLTASDHDSTMETMLTRRMVELAFCNGRYAVIFSLINVIVLVALFHGHVNMASLWCWSIIITFVHLGRLLLLFGYYRHQDRFTPEQWTLLFTIGAGVSGLLWGMTIPLFSPSLPLLFQAFLILLIGGIIAAASAFQASIYNSYLSFSLAASVPMVYYLALSDMPFRYSAAGLTTVFTILMLIVTRRMHRSIHLATAMEFNNFKLLKNLQTSEERFRTLTESSASAYFILVDYKFVYVNPMCQRMTGYTLKELQHQSLLDIVHPEHREMVMQRAAERFSSKPTSALPKRYEFKIRHKDGHDIWIDYTAGLMEIDGKKAVMGTAFDITDKKRAEKRIALSEKRFRMLFNMANDPMYLIEMGEGLNMGKFKDVNHAACEALGYSREELLNLGPEDVSAEDNPNLYRAILAKLSMDGKIVFETEYRTKDDRILPVEVSSHMARFEGKTIIHSTTRDISLRKQLMEKLTEQANTDPLTGCLNRRSFWSRGAREVDRANRYERPLVLLMIDLDHFKVINDTHGHSMGDMVLRSLVTKCHTVLRTTDIFGRIGGEEFTALLVETDLNEGMAVAERIRLELQQMTTTYGSMSISCTVSIGLAMAQGEEQNLDQLMNRADKALYHAKQTGRNRVVSYSDIPLPQ